MIRRSQDGAARGQTHYVVGREGRLDYPELIVGLGLQLEDDAALAKLLGLQNYVMLTATVDIGDWVP